MGNAISESEDAVVEVGNLIIAGINHFDVDAGRLRRLVESVEPAVIGIESFEEKFALDQFNMGTSGKTVGEIGVLTVSAFADGIDLALVDDNWGDLESEYDANRRSEILSTAQERAGQGTNRITSKQEADAANDHLKQIDPTFYNEFVLTREIAMAQKASWLQNRGYKSILVCLGQAHIYNVRDYVEDIHNRGQVNPCEPTVYGPAELDEFVVSDAIIEQRISETMDPAPPLSAIQKRLGGAKESYKSLLSQYRAE